MQCASDRLLHVTYVHRTAYNDRLAVDGTLLIADIHSGIVVSAAVDIAHRLILRHTDDFPWNFRSELCFSRHDFLNEYAFANGVLAREVFAGHGLIDDRNGQCSFGVAVGERSPLAQRHADCAEVGSTYHFEETSLTIGAVDNGLVRPLKRHTVAPALHRKSGC